MNNSAIFSRFLQEKKPQTITRKEKKCIIYTRVSSKRQVDGASLAFQRKTCEALAKREGYIIDCYFGAKHESAKIDERKAYQEMLKYAKKNKHKISAIIVYTYSRFSRTGSPASNLINQLRDKYNILVISATSMIDITTSSGELQKDVELAFDKFDNSQRKQFCMDGMKEKLEAGFWVWKAPRGYTNKNKGLPCDQHILEINEEGKLLQRAFEMKSSGLFSDVQIHQKLWGLGLKINIRRLCEIFQNPFYCGLIITKMTCDQVIEGKHPPLVSKEVFMRINGLYYDIEKQKRNTANEDLPLKGFVRCDETDSPLTGYVKHQWGLYYYKSRVKGQAINKNAKELHRLFLGLLGSYQLSTDLVPVFKEMVTDMYHIHSKESEEDLHQLRGERDKITKAMGGMKRRYAEGELTRTIFEEFYPEKQKELDGVERELYRMEQNSSSKLDYLLEKAAHISGNLSEIWQSSDYANKQRLQYLVFPEGIRYNRKNNTVRSLRVNSIFAAIPQLTGHLEGGGNSSNPSHGVNGGLVILSGVEGQTKCNYDKTLRLS